MMIFKQFKICYILFSTVFVSSMAMGQGNIPDCKTLQFGDFVSGNPADSIYVRREFMNWYEVNVARGFRNIFTIVWRDNCNFSLILRDCSAADKAFHPYQVNDTLNYQVIASTPNTINFRVNYRNKTFSQTLSQQPGLDMWPLLLTSEEQWNDSSMFSDIESRLPDSIKMKMRNAWKSSKVTFNQAEVEQVESVLSLLKQRNIMPVYAISSYTFREIVSQQILADFNSYLKYVYGALKSYSVLSSPMRINFNGLLNRAPVTGSNEYKLDACFENAKGNVVITVGVTEDSIYKITKLNVQPDKNTALPFIDSLTGEFRSRLKAGEYEKIYRDASILLKKNLQGEGLKTVLSLISDDGHLDDYKLSKQDFGADEGRGFISTTYEMRDSNGNSSSYTLNYVIENGAFKLGGVYLQMK